MATVGFLGTGLLGSGMVERMLRNGDAVTVWNRTEAKARALEPLGAKVAASPGEAVAGAERVHMTLPDDVVVDRIVDDVRRHLGQDAIPPTRSPSSRSFSRAASSRRAARKWRAATSARPSS